MNPSEPHEPKPMEERRMNKHHLLTGRKLDPYTITVLRDLIHARVDACLDDL